MICTNTQTYDLFCYYKTAIKKKNPYPEILQGKGGL